MSTTVPPGGFAGFAQQAPANQQALRMVRPTKSRSGKAAKRRYARNKRVLSGKQQTIGRSRKRKRSGGKKKLVKGSAEAKRFMAALRKKRRR